MINLRLTLYTLGLAMRGGGGGGGGVIFFYYSEKGRL